MRATARSCAAASQGTIRLPTASPSRATGTQSAMSASSSRQVTQAAPANRSAEPASQPENSVPVIGCDPTNRAPGTSSATSLATEALTLATSVSRAPGARSATDFSNGRKAVTGAANTISASSARARSRVVSRSSSTVKPSAGRSQPGAVTA